MSRLTFRIIHDSFPFLNGLLAADCTVKIHASDQFQHNEDHNQGDSALLPRYAAPGHQAYPQGCNGREGHRDPLPARD
jgi:hypothetical protein